MLQCVIVLAVRGVVGRIWTQDVGVLDALPAVIVPMALSMMGDGVCAVMSGMMMGMVYLEKGG